MSGKPTGAFCSNIREDWPAELQRRRGGRIPALPVSPYFEEFCTVSKLPVLFPHAPHLITDTCLSKNWRDRPKRERERTFQAFQEFPSFVTLSVFHTKLHFTLFLLDILALKAPGDGYSKRLFLGDLLQNVLCGTCDTRRKNISLDLVQTERSEDCCQNPADRQRGVWVCTGPVGAPELCNFNNIRKILTELMIVSCVQMSCQ